MITFHFYSKPHYVSQVGPVLYGSVAEWIIQDRKGLRKFTNFERLMQQDPAGVIFQVRDITITITMIITICS